MAMFDTDIWTEIFESVKRNKLRTFLTGFAISWGIFMFVILLAVSNSVYNGITDVFAARASNIIQLRGGITSVPYKGFPNNRQVMPDEKDYDFLDNQVSEKEYLSPTILTDVLFSSGKNYAKGKCVGIYPEYSEIRRIKILDGQGRLINDRDMEEKRKVLIINKRMQEVLYKNESPVGKNLSVNDMNFTIIGVFEESAIINTERAYIPFSTSQILFYGGWGLEQLDFTVKNLDTNSKNEAFSARLEENLARMHQFDPKDKVAMHLYNNLKTYLQTIGIFNTILIFIWIIGAGTLFAGIVGTSNIMLITVRERTKEMGIRKALGATPFSILKGIILESICITSLFGCLGLYAGLLVSALFNLFLKSHPDITKLAIFKNAAIDMDIAIGGIVILILSGVLAGYFPARQAVKIMPVEAMRAE